MQNHRSPRLFILRILQFSLIVCIPSVSLTRFASIMSSSFNSARQIGPYILSGRWPKQALEPGTDGITSLPIAESSYYAETVVYWFCEAFEALNWPRFRNRVRYHSLSFTVHLSVTGIPLVEVVDPPSL
ncbi:hypothetical protein FB446DRAFT_201275 [Lentinula raphanica]|nr:hypothetical protein FB446DRAFT_201275 [Lentinula raphanica]